MDPFFGVALIVGLPLLVTGVALGLARASLYR